MIIVDDDDEGRGGSADEGGSDVEEISEGGSDVEDISDGGFDSDGRSNVEEVSDGGSDVDEVSDDDGRSAVEGGRAGRGPSGVPSADDDSSFDDASASPELRWVVHALRDHRRGPDGKKEYLVSLPPTPLHFFIFCPDGKKEHLVRFF